MLHEILQPLSRSKEQIYSIFLYLYNKNILLEHAQIVVIKW